MFHLPAYCYPDRYGHPFSNPQPVIDPDSIFNPTAVKLSVITNTKNEGPRVRSTCEEFLRAGADEVIVCADGVTDGSCDDLPKGVKVLWNEESVGCGKAKVQATDTASGDVLLWVDAHQNVLEGDIRAMAKQAIDNGTVVTPRLANIFYDETWQPKRLSDKVFHPNDAAIVPNCTQQYALKPAGNKMIGVGLCMSRETYERVGGWNRFLGRHGSQERGMALRAFMAGVPVELGSPLLGHEFFGDEHPSRNKAAGKYKFNNLVHPAYNVWHAYAAVCSPAFFEEAIAPWLVACGLEHGRKGASTPELIQDRDYFHRHCKRRTDGELLEMLSGLVATHFPPSDPGTATLEPMALSFIKSMAKGRCLECGTGSTGGTKAMLQGARSVVSIDHMEKYASEAKTKLSDPRVTFLHCPKAANGFYDLSAIQGRFDFILLDGPPGTQARKQGIQTLFPYLAPGGILLVDDAKRDAANVEAARQELGFNVEMLPTRRGLAKITRLNGIDSALD